MSDEAQKIVTDSDIEIEPAYAAPDVPPGEDYEPEATL